MASERTPQQIIGDDAYTQLVFEGYVVTRPAPAATDTGLETVAKQWKVTAKNWSGLKPEISEPFDERELVTRENAEAVIAKVEAEKAKAVREAGHYFAETCMMAEQIGKLTDTGLVTIGFVPPMFVEGKGEGYSDIFRSVRISENHVAVVTRSQAEELLAAEREAQQRLLDIIEEANDDKEALEAKLAAAEKALEPFAKIPVSTVPEGRLGHVPDKHPYMVDLDGNVLFTASDIRKARAVLGGK